MTEPKKIAMMPVLNQLLEINMDSLTTRQLFVLAKCRKTPQTVRGLAEEMQRSKPAVTRAMDRLEKEGLGQRVPDQKDRRSIFFKVTPKGQEFLSRFK